MKRAEYDAKLTTWGGTQHENVDDEDDGSMAQIIISKETSQGRGAAQLDAARRKTFIMRVAVFIIFLPRLILVLMLAAVASQTTNLHLKQERGERRMPWTLRKRKRKGTKAWATPLHVLFLHPEGICRKDSSYDISDLSNCAVNMRREPEMNPELEQMGQQCELSRFGTGCGFRVDWLLCSVSLVQI